jgi:hypothetical protein
MATPQEHYGQAVDLMNCIVVNKDDPDFITDHANTLAQSAQAQALMGLLKLEIDKRHDQWLEITTSAAGHLKHIVTDPYGGGVADE